MQRNFHSWNFIWILLAVIKDGIDDYHLVVANRNLMATAILEIIIIATDTLIYTYDKSMYMNILSINNGKYYVFCNKSDSCDIFIDDNVNNDDIIIYCFGACLFNNKLKFKCVVGASLYNCDEYIHDISQLELYELITHCPNMRII